MGGRRYREQWAGNMGTVKNCPLREPARVAIRAVKRPNRRLLIYVYVFQLSVSARIFPPRPGPPPTTLNKNMVFGDREIILYSERLMIPRIRKKWSHVSVCRLCQILLGG